MIGVLPLLFAVTLLSDAQHAEIVDTAKKIVEIEDDGNDIRLPESAREAERLVITAERTDLDREEGVIMFEGDAKVAYSAGFEIYANQMFAFLKGSNELSRIVAVGKVALTNETRSGACAMAIFRRLSGEIEMHGEKGGGAPARLIERGADEIAGRRIKFWIDAEQVEIEDSEIVFEKGSAGKNMKGLK